MKKIVLLAALIMNQSIFAQDIYLLETKIGGRVFGDLLVIDSFDHHKFKGSLTVPGVYTSKITDGVISDSSSERNFTFSILVHENNEEYGVNYRLVQKADGSLSGALMQDNTVIGEITGKQLQGAVNESGY